MIPHRLLITLLLVTFMTASCGGDSLGMSPPADLSYPAPPAFTVKQAIAPLTPTVDGQVTSYSASPALPAGLTLNASTGVISGTPTVAAPKTTYTITARNAGGQTTAGVSIVVDAAAAAPLIAYQSPYYAFSLDVAGRTSAPTVSGGSVSSWGVSPALPAGLTLSQTDGSIGGTPASAAAAGVYTVTATNSGGQSIRSR